MHPLWAQGDTGHATHIPQLAPNPDGTLLQERDIAEQRVSKSQATPGDKDLCDRTGCTSGIRLGRLRNSQRCREPWCVSGERWILGHLDPPSRWGVWPFDFSTPTSLRPWRE